MATWSQNRSITQRSKSNMHGLIVIDDVRGKDGLLVSLSKLLNLHILITFNLENVFWKPIFAKLD